MPVTKLNGTHRIYPISAPCLDAFAFSPNPTSHEGSARGNFGITAVYVKVAIVRLIVEKFTAITGANRRICVHAFEVQIEFCHFWEKADVDTRIPRGTPGRIDR